MHISKQIDCSILEGHRSEARQRKLHDAGKSKLTWPYSKHNNYPSEAVDVAPYPIDWDDIKRFYFFGGYVLAIAAEMGIPIRWGGDWDCDLDFNDQGFNDLVHFELKNGCRLR